MAEQIPVIVITGGPNGGKTSILKYLEAHFIALGYTVVVIPEVATNLINDRMGPAQVGMDEFQRHVLVMSLEEEWRAKEQLRHAAKPLIFADRGVMDGAAYVEREVMEKLWDELGYNLIHLRDERYAGVIHLESTAIGLPELYLETCGNNAARYETTVELAAETDRRTLAAWVGTPHLAYLDNSTDFEGKIARAIAWAESFVSGKEHERKFKLLAPFSSSLLPSHAQCIDIRQSYIYLPGSPKNHRVRMRGQNGTYSYIQTMKQMTGPMSSTEDESLINESEYIQLRDAYGISEHHEVVKQRWCFVENGHYWELDVFQDLPGLVLMEAEVPVDDPPWPLELPAWVGANVTEVTGQSGYSNKDIAAQIGMRTYAA